MLKATGIKKKYGNLEVLKGIDLEIAKGEVVSIVGASGAGKSTLLHILGSLDTPDEGTIELSGKDVFKLTSTQLASFRNKEIGFVFQFHNLLPEFTALENVCIPGYIGGRNDGEVVKRAKELLQLLGLGARLDHKPSALSGGEQQRTAIARALINSPSIVFGDEPSGNLDSKNANELHNLFFKIREELGHTFVIVTHNEEFAAMADRTLEIQDGMVLTDAGK
ncbi:ABC transporter ATP-binding protein [uncultured Imperialibacter sp.]|uniref:ABC transporter ATP-binding protein n=1 Tax=uncultured Imperialibacter sp. TaxID=1672639 RepID=UPI0030DDCE28|tara:strand:- start:548 stop:1213 length:666 start_codon:yes stop_codon:yes gene_type:complete